MVYLKNKDSERMFVLYELSLKATQNPHFRRKPAQETTT